jgi:hypothetical protein
VVQDHEHGQEDPDVVDEEQSRGGDRFGLRCYPGSHTDGGHPRGPPFRRSELAPTLSPKSGVVKDAERVGDGWKAVALPEAMRAAALQRAIAFDAAAVAAG